MSCANIKFRNLVVTYRKKRGISGTQLSKELGIPQWRVSRIETGKRDITLSEALLFSKYLGFSLSKLDGK